MGPELRCGVSLQLVGVATVPLNVTVFVPCVAPNVVPVNVTSVPTGPESGDRPVIRGTIVKFTALLASPPTVTTILLLPMLTPLGTSTTIRVAVQFTVAAGVPFNVTVLAPCVAPKFVPESSHPPHWPRGRDEARDGGRCIGFSG